ncbi:alpha-ketoglutarate-dependent dioxygenase AlkB family protein [Chitinophaga sp.]|uniref:alpha-ketoglutarate-dependent dioxygenase AlkB family protein n=1 Tax=Chitinophaga sp. TaxID=1869181 RepID=UPI002FDEBE02
METFPYITNSLPKDGDARLFPGFFTAAESDRFLDALTQGIQWKQEPITIMGRQVMQPRLTAWYGDVHKSYTYSGVTMRPLPWTDELLNIRARIEAVSGVAFTSALLNFYRDGNDSMGWHRDNEKSLGPQPVIGSVSFGAARYFHFKHAKDKDLRIKTVLTHGSFLLMRGSTQENWYHSVPKTTRVAEPRINITFRVIV